MSEEIDIRGKLDEVIRLLNQDIQKGFDHLVMLGEHEKEIRSLRAQIPRWIPVTERMPEVDVDILFFSTDGYIQIGHMEIRDDIRVFLTEEWMQQFGVTHWMPLPEVPE